MNRCTSLIVLLCFLLAACNETKSKSSLGSIPQAQLTNHVSEFSVTIDTIVSPYAPTRITRRIRNTADGDLLLASFTDVLSFDGNIFTPLPSAADSSGFNAFDALEDTQGTIWIASTHYGVYRYDHGMYTHYTIDNGLANNRTIDIYEDKAGNIWISSGGGISRYDGSSWTVYTADDGLPTDDVNRIIQDTKGTYWIGTRSLACTYDGISFTKITTQDGLALRNIRHIIEDRNGGIWLGGGEGLWYYDGSIYTQLSQEMMVGIHEDREGVIWTISSHSISYGWQAPDTALNVSTDKTNSVRHISSPGSVLFGIGEDRDGNIWIGTGNGVLTCNQKSMKIYVRE